MEIKDVAIVGCGGHSKVVTNMLKLLDYNIIGYYDDNLEPKMGFKILGKIKDMDPKIPNFVCAIGDNNTRKNIVEKNKKLNWINIIHPSAILADDIMIGVGNVICAGVIIQSDTIIGNHNIFNTRVNLDHDNVIGSFAHIGPGVTLCGTVIISNGTFIGAGSTVINNLSIGAWSIIGSGSNVIRNIPDKYVAYGNPCKLKKIAKKNC